MTEEELLAGGNVGQVWRVGTTVRRETGPWSPAVHAYLSHLARRGIPGVPEVHGLDERGREILDFLPGTIVDVDHDLLTDEQLTSLVRWTRELHDVAVGFAHDGPWRNPPATGATVVGHNDLAPYNVVFDGDDLAGVFDWDMAGPTTPALELGCIAWNCVPLVRS